MHYDISEILQILLGRVYGRIFLAKCKILSDGAKLGYFVDIYASLMPHVEESV